MPHNHDVQKGKGVLRQVVFSILSLAALSFGFFLGKTFLVDNKEGMQVKGTMEELHEIRKTVEDLTKKIEHLEELAHTVDIDWFKPFDLKGWKEFSEGWTVEEQDERSSVTTTLDLRKVHFVDCLKDGEDKINGEERLRRLKKMGSIRLNVNALQAIFENRKLIPESWKQYHISFDGTVFRDEKGERCILYLYWNEENDWEWQCNWLRANNYCLESPSAVLRD